MDREIEEDRNLVRERGRLKVKGLGGRWLHPHHESDYKLLTVA